MSLLMFSHETTGFVVLTDTFATTTEGDPRTFQSKLFPFPHLNMVMGGTGVGQLMERWWVRVQSHMLVRDVETLDLHAPDALREIWASMLKDLDGLASAVGRGLTSTIYHFGFTAAGRPVRFTYRSARGFESEMTTDPGLGIKPIPRWQHPAPESLDDMVAIAVQLREQEDARPKEERVHLGGDLVATFIGDHSIQSQRVFRWADFDEHWLAMNSALPANRGHRAATRSEG